MQAAKKYGFLEAKTKIEAWCAYQERCQLEVEKKLRSFGLFEEDVSALCSDLISNNFLNEERFAQAYCSGKFRIKKWGRIKIRTQLKLKQISEYSIKKGLQEIDEEEYLQCIENLIERKRSDLKKEKNHWTRKAKIIRFLQSKGFEMELIQDGLKEN